MSPSSLAGEGDSRRSASGERGIRGALSLIPLSRLSYAESTPSRRGRGIK